MERYWSFSASSPGILHDGRRFIVAMAVDITERRRAEESLRESEERFRLLVEGTRDYAMFLMDAQRRIVHWNHGAERIFGWTRDEAIGQMGDMIFVAEDIDAGAPEQESQTAVRNGSAADIRWHLRKNGSRFWADGVNTSLKDENGKVRGFAKITRDATKEKEDEDALRQAHEELHRAHDELEQRVLERTAALRGEMKERRKSEQAREQLLQRIVALQEEERRRISRELHDQLGQQLTALIVGLKSLSALVDSEGQPASSSQQVEYLQNLSEEMMQQMHQLAWELRPSVLDNFGLEPTLQQYVQEWSHQSGIKADFVTRGLEKKMRVNPEIETALYRVVQEALTNVQRHSGAQLVSVVLERRGSQLVAIVEDDGQGFKISRSKGRASKTSGKGQARLGLLGMQERMELIEGTLEIESAPGQGTTVYARVSIK
jgi:PAS domain S-box-containing protein